MRNLQQIVESVANIQIPLLIQGESGTGKELCVRLIHALSGHNPAELVKVSCPSIPAALMETELFGYEKGAFTGAQSGKQGRVEKAQKGTLFLDEVGSLDLNCQAKLLQFLQDGSFSRVGGHDLHKVKTRFISVANRDLRDQVAEGSFRLDLLYRMNTITLEIPPLRERTEDLPDLVDYFVEQHARMFRVKQPPISRAVLRQMANYDWPGNIRQLENLLRGYVLLQDENALLAELIPEVRSSESCMLQDIDVSAPISLKTVTRRATHELERRVILKVLKANGWNRQKTAKWLKISYRSLLYKLNETDPDMVPKMRQAPAKPATLVESAFQTAPRLL